MNKTGLPILIEDCGRCSNHCIKSIDGKDYMFCQTSRSCICLCEGTDSCKVPEWCPRPERIAVNSVKHFFKKIKRLSEKVIERICDKH